MCRIYGFLGQIQEEEIVTALERASDLQHAGGPDEQGYFYTSEGGIGANRLAVQGLDGGAQPYYLGGNIHAVFNGEIYNHKQLRRDLETRGYVFHDTCDGSIIPALYRE
jgi:asparagine synthase (glutamine-hydrolysing)